MSNPNKKSVLMDLSDAGGPNENQRTISVVWLCLGALLLFAAGLYAFLSISGQGEIAETSLEQSKGAQSVEPAVSLASEVVAAPLSVETAVAEAQAESFDLSESLESKSLNDASEMVPLMQVGQAQGRHVAEVDAATHLSEIEAITEQIAAELARTTSDHAIEALAFQLEEARALNSDQSSILMLETAYAQALSKQGIASIRRDFARLDKLAQEQAMQNYATLEWQQYLEQVEHAEGLATEAGPYAMLKAYQQAYESGKQFEQVSLKNLSALAQRAMSQSEPARAVELYQKLRLLDSDNAEALSYLHQHAYAAGERVHVAPFGIRMRMVPAGNYTIGTPELEFQRDADEHLHSVTLTRAYYIAETELTQGQWMAVMGELPQQMRNDASARGDTLPVHSVTWTEAVNFCEQLSAHSDSMQYRLPSEAEWEIACRANQQAAYNTGSNQLSLQQANVFDPKSPRNHDQALPVASYQPNDWGLYDMHGNVWEWCHDWLADYSQLSPVDPMNAEGGNAADENLRTKVLRGGSYYDEAPLSRSGNRWSYAPSVATQYIGFRIASTAQF